MAEQPGSDGLHIDLALVVGGGVVAAVCADRWFGGFHLGGPWTSSDFQDYCAGVWSLWTDAPDAFPAKRARLAGVLSAWTGASDVAAALARGAWLGAFGVFISLAAWARVLGGRWAVAVALGLVLAVSPVVLTSRIHTFYPAMNAVLVGGSGLVALALARPHPATLALAGAGVGLALSIDVRGVLWAAPWLLGAGVAAMWPGPHRGWRWVALVVPLVLSFGLGAWSFPEDALSLEQQLDVRPLAEFRAGGEEARSAWSYTSRFVWGHTAPWAVFGTFWFLLHNQSAAPEALGELSDFAPIVSAQLDPWLGPLVVGLLGAVVVLRRAPRRLVALVVTVVPFLLALLAARTSVELQLRFLSQALVVVPLVVGVAVGGVMVGRTSRKERLIGAGVVGLLYLSVFGVVPGPLSPMADWRRTWPPNTLDFMRTTHHNAYTHLRPEFRTCREALGLPVIDDSAVGPAPQQLRGEDFQPISPPVAPR